MYNNTDSKTFERVIGPPRRHHFTLQQDDHPVHRLDIVDDDTEQHTLYCMDIMVDGVDRHTLGQHKRVTVHLVGAVLQKETVNFMDRVHVDGASRCTLSWPQSAIEWATHCQASWGMKDRGEIIMATMIVDVFGNWTSLQWVNYTADVAPECPLRLRAISPLQTTFVCTLCG